MGQCHGRLQVTCAGAAGGGRAEEQREQRVKSVPQERRPERKPSGLGVLLVDGWQVRHRGPGWGAKKTQQNRVEWHEMKMGIYYQAEHAVVKENGRGELAEKVVVSTLADAVELGQRLHWEAMRRGIGAGQKPGNVGGRGALDLEFEAGPMESSGGDAGFLSRQRTCVGVGSDGQRRERSQRLGGTLAAPVTAWERAKSVAGNSRVPGPRGERGESFGGSRTILPVMSIA